MLKNDSKLDMTFASFFEIYEADKKKRVKENTWESKSHVIRTKILPYFGERKIAEIEPKDVIAWQNELLFLHDMRVPANNSLCERLARVYKRISEIYGRKKPLKTKEADAKV